MLPSSSRPKSCPRSSAGITSSSAKLQSLFGRRETCGQKPPAHADALVRDHLAGRERRRRAGAVELEAPAAEAGAPEPEAGAEAQAEGATLRVCAKCVGRLKKKGVDFDPLAALERLSDRISVESVSCLKHCKFGPNAEVVMDRSGTGAAAVVDGMTEDEVTRRCFQQVRDRASAARVADLVLRALGGRAAAGEEDATLAEGEAMPGARVEPRGAGIKRLELAGAGELKEDPPADAERARRARVRANVRSRVERIVAGIEEDEI